MTGHTPIWRHRLTHQDGVCTIALAGELDLACAAPLQALLFEKAQTSDISEVRVDRAEVGFLDSTALGVAVGGLHHAQEQGRSFAVVSPSPPARRLLEITGLDTVPIHP